MTKEEAIEKCKKIINTNNNVIKEARRVRDINTMQLVASLDDESIAIETVLNMLKEKDAEIEKYKKLLADNLAKELNNSIKAKEKADTDLDDLDKGWKVELEKKDKMIDLMAEHICSSAIVDDTICAIKCDCETDIEEDCTHEKMINCTKQHFERKAKYGR
jgi:methyl coenzyme M reductase beta subunit